MDLDQRHLALDELALVDVDDLDHIDHFVELFDDLLDDAVVAAGHDRHQGNRRVHRWRYAERFNVVPTAAEQIHDARQDAELVFDQDRNDVLHGSPFAYPRMC